MKHLDVCPRIAAAVTPPLDAAALLGCRGGGDHEDVWLWVLMGTLDPPDIYTGTGPTYPVRTPTPPA